MSNDLAAIYALEQLRKAVRALVISTGDIKYRLKWAADEFHTAMAGDIPDPDLRTAFVRLKRDLNAVPGDGGSLAATIKKLRKKETSEIAERIFDLYVDLHDLVRRSER